MNILSSANLLAWAIQAGVIVLVSAPLPRLLGIWSPRARMIYWRVVLVGCLLLPLLQPWHVLPGATDVPSALAPPPAPGSALEVVVQPPTGGTAQVPTATGMVQAALDRLREIGIGRIIVAGIVLRLAWLGLGLMTVARLRRAASRLWPRPESVDRAASLAETDAEFLVSPTSSRPVTCGVLWPVVLVPRNFETFPPAEQTAIACHELLHVGRGDWVRNAADEVVRALAWFHPGVWWLVNQIQLAREQVVDREAVRRLGTKQPYLEALLRLANPAPRLILTPASAFLKRAHLRERVTLLVKEVSMSRARLVASFAAMAVVVFVGGRIVTAAFPLQQAGAATPGAATAAPKLADARPMTVKFADGIKARQVLEFVAQAAGLTVTYEPGIDQALNANVGPIEAKDVTLTAVLAQVLGRAHLEYKVVGERAILVRSAMRGSATGGLGGGVYTPGSVPGSPRPGMAAGTGTGTGSGTGRGSGAGVAGGVSGGGIGASVPGGVTGGIVGGVPAGVTGGIVGGVPGGVQGGVIGGVPTQDAQAATTRSSPLNVVTRVDPNAPGLTGRAIVGAVVGPDGAAAMAGRMELPGTPVVVAVAEAAVEAARQWVFEPGTADRPVILGFNLTPQNTNGLVNAAIVRVGGDVKPPRKLLDVKPVYPAEALASRQQGVQILEISVAPSGEVLDARSLRGTLPLVRSAIDAVLQWKFDEWPGPERRLMTVTVNFTLGDGAPAPISDAAPGMTTTPPPPASWPANAIRVGGDIKPPTRIRDVKPVYPKEAQDARVQGVCIIQALVGPDGKVADARILRSIPMLDAAALEAVRQWEFTPTLLNGVGVPVIMTVTVNFTLM
jgi:TonB family protein